MARVTTPRSRSASAMASAASAALCCDSRLTRSSFGIVPFSISRRFASSSVLRWVSRALACATCASRASSESTAITSPFFHLVAAPDPELGEDAAGARNHHHLAVGFGAAGQHELAAVRQAVRLGDCDAEQLLRRRFGWTDGGVAFAVLMRQQVPGGDPEAGAEHQADGGEAACFHLCISDGWSPDALAVRRL